MYIIYNKIFFLAINFCNWSFCLTSNYSLRPNNYLGEIRLRTFGIARFSSNLAHRYILVKHSVTIGNISPFPPEPIKILNVSYVYIMCSIRCASHEDDSAHPFSYSPFLCKFNDFCVDISKKIRVDIRNLKSRKSIPHLYPKK